MKFPETNQNTFNLVKEVERLSKLARDLGATKGAQRLHFVGQYYRRLSIEEAYHLIDPEALQHEVEEIQGHNPLLKLLYFLRIAFSISPLILTWIALFYATTAYQEFLQRYPSAVYTPFLELWQSGFGGETQFTFAAAAFLDASLLIIFLFVSLVILFLENRASKKSRNFANELEAVTDGLINTVAKEGLAPLTSDKDFDKIAAAISFGLNQNIKASEEIVRSATTGVDISKNMVVETSMRIKEMTSNITKMMEDMIKQSNKQLENLFNNEIKIMIDRFREDLSVLHDDLSQLGTDMDKLRGYVQKHDERLKELTEASSLLAGASTNLDSNASKMASSTNEALSINEEIRNHIRDLNTTQRQLLTDIEKLQKGLITQIEAVSMNLNTAVQSVTENLYQSTRLETQAMVQKVTEVADQVSKIAVGLSSVSGILSQADSPLIQAAEKLQDAAHALADSQELTKVESALSQLDLHLSIMIKEIQNAPQAFVSNRVRIKANSSLHQPLENASPQPRSFWDRILRR